MVEEFTAFEHLHSNVILALVLLILDEAADVLVLKRCHGVELAPDHGILLLSLLYSLYNLYRHSLENGGNDLRGGKKRERRKKRGRRGEGE